MIINLLTSCVLKLLYALDHFFCFKGRANRVVFLSWNTKCGFNDREVRVWTGATYSLYNIASYWHWLFKKTVKHRLSKSFWRSIRAGLLLQLYSWRSVVKNVFSFLYCDCRWGQACLDMERKGGVNTYPDDILSSNWWQVIVFGCKIGHRYPVVLVFKLDLK